MNVLEVAIYALVVAGQPQAVKCVDSDVVPSTVPMG